MLVPGDYDVPPGSTAMQALQWVISASTANWNATDIVDGSKALGQTPYHVAVVASLTEREGDSPSNMPQVARVIYNRLAINMKLQLDSTVDYALGHSQDLHHGCRARRTPSPYNTRIWCTVCCRRPSPHRVSTVWMASALNPADGKWLYFVKVDLKGNFCFSVTYAEHNKCVEQARANGVFGG